MKFPTYPMLGVLCLSCFSGCDNRGSGDNVELSVNEVLENQELYLGKTVVINAYLNTHHDGPWISEEISNPLNKVIALEVGSDSKIVKSNPNEDFWWWYQYGKPFPVKIKGVFRLRDLKVMGGVLQDNPVMEVVWCERLSENSSNQQQ